MKKINWFLYYSNKWFLLFMCLFLFTWQFITSSLIMFFLSFYLFYFLNKNYSLLFKEGFFWGFFSYFIMFYKIYLNYFKEFEGPILPLIKFQLLISILIGLVFYIINKLRDYFNINSIFSTFSILIVLFVIFLYLRLHFFALT